MKDFIPFTEALELKLLGFDEPCFRFQNNISHIIEEKGWLNWNEVEQFVSLPTFSQAFRFFREKYDLFISIMHYENGYSINDLRRFHTYDEAELECLKKLIQIVKQKQ